MARFSDTKRKAIVEHARKALGTIADLIESGASNANKTALVAAKSAFVHADRWIVVPTLYERSLLQTDCRAILENVAESSNRADRALAAFARGLLQYSHVYYARAERELNQAKILAE